MRENTSTYGPLFWTALAVGVVVMGFGVWSVLSRAGSTHPPELAAWVVGLALVHDLVLVPVTLGVAMLLRGSVPRLARGLVLGAMTISGILILYAIPLLGGWGLQPDNPSFLPRRYGLGLGVTLAAIWVVTALMLARRWKHR